MQCQPWDNPMGTDAFEFVEYAAPDPKALGALFVSMGFTAIARHRHKDVTLYRQGGINFIINAEQDCFAQRFARTHGPSVCAIALRVEDAALAYRRALELGAWGFDNKNGPMELNIPAIKGVGDSLLYFVDRWRGKGAGRGGQTGGVARRCAGQAPASPRPCTRHAWRRSKPLGATCRRAPWVRQRRVNRPARGVGPWVISF